MLVKHLKQTARDTNFWTGLGVILLAIFLYSASFDIREFITTRVGASFLPRLTAVLFAILGAILVLGSFRCARPVETVEQESEVNATAKEPQVFGGLPAVGLSVLLMSLYVGLINSVGFIVTSAVYIFLQILVLSKDAKRNYLLFVLVSIIIPVVVYLLFVKIFKVMIPAGILG